MTSPLLRLSVYPVPHVMYLTQAKEPMVLSHLLVYKNGVVNYRIGLDLTFFTSFTWRICVCEMTNEKLYRETQQVADLGLVDLDLGCSTMLLGQ